MVDTATPAPAPQTWDPSIVNLAKSIRDNESGNQVVPGKTGELPSRYQWEPDTWKAAAGQYLNDPNAPITLQNENYVAYKRIEAWKNQGMNPLQIASMWNSGNPDPNNNSTTSAYAQRVYASYQKYKGGISAPASPMTASETAPVLPSQTPAQEAANPSGQPAPTLAQAASVAEKIPGVKTLGNVFGTQLAAMGQKDPQIRQNILSTMPSVEKTAGAALETGGIVASLPLAPATLPGTVAAGAGIGAAEQGGAAMEQEKPAGEVAKQAGTGAVIGAAASAAAYGFGKLLSALGEKITNVAIKPTMADYKDGFSTRTIKDFDLGGSLSTMYTKTEAKMADLTQQLNDKLGSSDATIDLGDVFKQTASDLQDMKAGGPLKTFGTNTKMSSALEDLQNEIAALGDSNLSIPQAQLVKQASGRMGAWQYGVTDPEATARETVYNTFYKNLKTAIEEGSPEGVQGINKQLSKLIPVMNAIIRRIPIAERNNALSLQDVLTLTASALDPRALVGFGISVAQKEGAVGNLLMKLGAPVAKAALPIAAGATSITGPQSQGTGQTAPTP